MNEKPGWLEYIYVPTQWMDLVFRSDLSVECKLVGAVIARTCVYSKRHQQSLSSISIYNISRILKMSKAETQKLIDLLVENGWLWETEFAVGAQRAYSLTFSVLPLNGMRK